MIGLGAAVVETPVRRNAISRSCIVPNARFTPRFTRGLFARMMPMFRSDSLSTASVEATVRGIPSLYSQGCHLYIAGTRRCPISHVMVPRARGSLPKWHLLRH